MKTKIIKSYLVFFLPFLILTLLSQACVSFGNETPVPESEFCEVPLLTGMSQEEAETRLEGMGFKPEFEYDYSDGVKSGFVISSTPEAGSELETCHTEIILLISQGPENPENEETQENLNVQNDVNFWDDWTDGVVPSIMGDAEFDLQIEGRKYTWVLQGETKSAIHYEIFDHEPENDRYSLSVDVKRTSGEAGSAAGLLFNYKDDNNYFLYSVVDTGYYLLDQMKEGKWVTLVEPQETDYALRHEFNRLRVVVDDGEYQFYINSRLVFTYEDPAPPLSGGQVGLAVRVVDSGTVFEFENFGVDRSDFAISTGGTQQLIYFNEDFEQGSAPLLIPDTLGSGSAEQLVEDGKYRWYLSTASTCKYRAVISRYLQPLPLDNYIVEVDVQQVSGSTSDCVAGIMFNFDTTVGSYAYFNINDQNLCYLNTYNAISRQVETLLFARNCYVEYGKPNHIRLDLTANTLKAYINDHSIFDYASEDEGVNYLEGDLGVQMFCSKNGETIYEFDNFEVYKLISE